MSDGGGFNALQQVDEVRVQWIGKWIDHEHGARSTDDVVVGDRDVTADLLEIGPVTRSRDIADLVGSLSDDVAPGVNGHRMPPAGLFAVRVGADLPGGEEERLGFDGSRATQHLPVVLAGLQRESGRKNDNVGSSVAQLAKKLGEAKVVTNGAADRHVVDLVGDDLF